MKRLCLVMTASALVTMLGSHSASGQTAVEAWVQRFAGWLPSTAYQVSSEDDAETVAVDSSGNVIVAGSSDANITGYDWLIIKYSGAGGPLWTNRYNGPRNGDDQATALAVAGNGNIYVAGYSSGNGGSNDYATIAYSAAGVPLWTNIYNGPGNGDDRASAVAVNASGNVFVAGYSAGSTNSIDYATIAYSAAGVPLWTNRYHGSGSGDASAVAVAADANGDVLVTGSSADSDGSVGYATIKYSGAGMPLWTNRFNGSGYAAGMAVDGSGNVSVTGFSAGSPYLDYCTIKYSGAGIPLWTNRYNGTGFGNDYAAAIAADSSGNVFVTGQSYSIDSYPYDYATIKYSAAGVPLWTNRYIGPNNYGDAATALAVDNSGNVVVTGYSDGNGTRDYATIKYSGAGVPLWTNRYDGGNDDSAKAIAVDGSGNVVVTGNSTALFGDDVATIKYSASGAVLWTNRYDGRGNSADEPTAIAVNGAGKAFVAGYSEDGFGIRHWVVVAYSTDGVPLWTNRYDGYESTDSQPNAVAVDASGNVFVAGVAVPDYITGQDFITIKYSGAGVPLWTNRYNGPGNGPDGVAAAAVDSGGNVIVAGVSSGTNGLSSFHDYATIKYSGAGVPLWTNRYNGPANNSDEPTDVAVDASGNVFVTGISYATNYADYATVAYSSAGVPLWTNRYDGTGNLGDDARAVAVDNSGNVFVTGDSWGDNEQDFVTIKYSGAGVPLWTNRYHGTSTQNDFVAALAVDGGGNAFVTGSDGGFDSTNGGYVTIKYSSGGIPLWTNHYNGPVTAGGANDNARALAVDANGNVIVTGTSYRDFVASDIVTVAYSNTGLPLWTNRYNGPANGDDIPPTKRSLALGPGGSVYVTGASDGDYSDNRIFDFATVKYVISPFAPSLNIARSDASVILSWPVTPLSFQLQENVSLSIPNGWSSVAQAAATNANQISVTVPSTAPRKFFRLKSQ